MATALGSGLVLILAFPPYDVWWCAPLAVAALALALREQSIRFSTLLGLVHGLAFFVPLLHWTGLYVGAWPWLLLAVVEASYLAVMAAGLSLALRPAWSGLSKRPGYPVWIGVGAMPVVVAALWVAQEAVRSRVPFGGFPWGRLAFSQADGPLLGLARIGGAPAVTAGVALLGGAIVAAICLAQKARGVSYRALAVTAGLVAIAPVLVVAGVLVPSKTSVSDRVVVAVVQGNVPRAGLDFNAQRRAVLDNHVAATKQLAAKVRAGQERQPDLVIWPENASDIDPLRNADAAELINEAARRIQAPILVGAVLRGPGRYISNVGLVWTPGEGPGERYVKRHPVPFAEYVPFRDFFRAITDKVDLVRRDFYASDNDGVLRIDGATLGDVICFEVAYDGLVRDTVVGGAQLVMVQTNNATFGRSAESAQQLAMVRLRAVEHGRQAVMASTSGTSAIVAASGRVLENTPLFTRRVIVREVELRDERTVATSLGAWPEWIMVFIASASITTGWWLARAHRGTMRGSRGLMPDVERSR